MAEPDLPDVLHDIEISWFDMQHSEKGLTDPFNIRLKAGYPSVILSVSSEDEIWSRGAADVVGDFLKRYEEPLPDAGEETFLRRTLTRLRSNWRPFLVGLVAGGIAAASYYRGVRAGLALLVLSAFIGWIGDTILALLNLRPSRWQGASLVLVVREKNRAEDSPEHRTGRQTLFWTRLSVILAGIAIVVAIMVWWFPRAPHLDTDAGNIKPPTPASGTK